MWSKDDDHNLRFTGRSCAEGGRVRERSRVASYRWGAYDGGSAECLVSTGGLSGVNESVGGAFPFCGGEWSSELRGRSCGCKRVWVSCWVSLTVLSVSGPESVRAAAATGRRGSVDIVDAMRVIQNLGTHFHTREQTQASTRARLYGFTDYRRNSARCG